MKFDDYRYEPRKPRELKTKKKKLQEKKRVSLRSHGEKKLKDLQRNQCGSNQYVKRRLVHSNFEGKERAVTAAEQENLEVQAQSLALYPRKTGHHYWLLVVR